MKYLVTATLGLLVFALPSAAQEEPVSNYEHLKALEPLVGNWHSERVAREDSPSGRVKKGDKVDVDLTIQWVADRTALTSELTFKAENKVIFRFTRLIGWQAKEKSIVAGGFNSDGGSVLVRYERTGEGYCLRIKGVNGSGKEIASTTMVSELTASSFVSQVVKRMEDGKEVPDSEKMLWKRVR